MLSREDYSNYLKQMLALERDMETFYAECAKTFSDKEAREVCVQIRDDETKHAAIVEAIMRIFENA